MIPHSRPYLSEEEITAVRNVIGSGMLIDGVASSEFVSALVTLTGARSATLVASGRLALKNAIDCLSLPPRSRILVQTYVCDAVPWAIEAAGHVPLFADIGPAWTLTPDTAAERLDAGFAAILLAPPFGLTQSAEPFRRFDVPIIGDLCQASPASLADEELVDAGDLVALSFHPTKYICASGGGAILCFDEAFLHSDLSADKDSAPFNEIQAAIGLAQLRRLNHFFERRSSIFQIYSDSASDRSISKLHAAMGRLNPGNLFRFPLTTDKKSQDVLRQFSDRGIAARHGVDTLSHRKFGLHDSAFPHAVDALNTTVSVPFHPSLSKSDIKAVANAVASLTK